MPVFQDFSSDVKDSTGLFEQVNYGASPEETLQSSVEASFGQALDYGLTSLGMKTAETMRLDGQTKSPFLNAQQAKEKYGISLNGRNKISEEAAAYTAKAANDDRIRTEALQRASQDWGTQAAIFGAGLVGNLLDPINLGLNFVPVVGEARALSWMNRFGPTTGRILAGGIDAVAGQAAVEPFTYHMARSLNYDYDAYDSFMNIAAGGIIGSGLHAGLGKVGDILGISPWSQRVEAGRIAPEEHHNMLRTAVGQMMDDRRVKVEPLYRQQLLQKLDELGPEFKQRLETGLRNQGQELTPDDVKLLSEYIMTSEQVNSSLRAGTVEKQDPSYRIGDTIQALDKMLDNNSLSSETKLYRGIELNLSTENPSLQKIVDLIEGKNSLLKDEGFLSTSLDEKSALSFTEGFYDPDPNAVPVIFELDVPAGHRALDVEKVGKLDDNIKEFLHQKEVILPRDTELVVNSIEKENINGKEGYRVKASAVDDIANTMKTLINDDMSPDKILSELENYQSIEGKWFYDNKITEEVSASLKEAPSVYNDQAAEKSLEKVSQKLDIMKANESLSEAELESLSIYDDGIKETESYGKALLSAAQCVLGEIF